jgi:hypothetical protein
LIENCGDGTTSCAEHSRGDFALSHRGPGLVSLKSAARAAIVMLAVFAFADKVIGNPQTTRFAAFGSFAMFFCAADLSPTRRWPPSGRSPDIGARTRVIRS